MRTNIVLNEQLVEEGLKLTRCSTKRELVELALRELVTRRKVKPLTDLAGKVQLHEGYDYKQQRELHVSGQAPGQVHDRAD